MTRTSSLHRRKNTTTQTTVCATAKNATHKTRENPYLRVLITLRVQDAGSRTQGAPSITRSFDRRRIARRERTTLARAVTRALETNGARGYARTARDADDGTRDARRESDNSRLVFVLTCFRDGSTDRRTDLRRPRETGLGFEIPFSVTTRERFRRRRRSATRGRETTNLRRLQTCLRDALVRSGRRPPDVESPRTRESTPGG